MKNPLLKRKKVICVAITLMITILPFIKVSFDFDIFAYGSTEITGIVNQGDSVTKTRSDGQDWTFTSPIKASYTIELFGPKANGDNAGNGGYVSANVILNAGQTINIYLGNGAPTMNGARDGLKGNSGSGYGDIETYKSAIMIDETVIMVSGGGGSAGNPGTGDGITEIRSELISEVKNVACSGCGKIGHSDGGNTHKHIWIQGAGGEGGEGGVGGNTSVTQGNPGKLGTVAHYAYTRLYYGAYFYSSSGNGGQGGNGGASYTNPLYCSSPVLAAGLNTGESKIIITMGGEILPPLDSKLIVAVKNELLEAIASMSMGGISAVPEIVPEITVLSGKQFYKTIAAYPDMNNGSSNGISVENNDKTNKTINISGRIDTSGSYEIDINGNSFVFHVVNEPDSSNVKVVFD